MSAQPPTWGTGAGNRRHLVIPESVRPARWAGGARRATAACQPGYELNGLPWYDGLRLDFFDDRDGKPAYPGATRTERELVMSRKPCARCAKRAAA